MHTNRNDIMKYLGAAAAVGGTVLLGSGLVGSNRSVKRKMKKTATKALNTVDVLISGMQNFVK